MTSTRRPLHLAVLAGVSAGTYAASLAVVTSWQSASDRSLDLSRAPAAQAVDDLTRSHDDLEAAIVDASRTYTLTADGYERIGTRLEATEAALDKLVKSVHRVTGGVGGLPTHVSLPKVQPAAPTAAPTPKPTKPPSHGATGGSG